MARKDERFDDLETRARDVLREIVLQYVSHGEPISSRSLAKSGRFGLSPASLRNVMADLEDLGYLYQPHTSAGRIPTDRGYRFFINNLMRQRRISQHEREMIDGRVGRANELDEVMQISSRVLAQLTDQVAIVFMPTLHHLVMRSVDFVWINERKVMCVVVATNGVVVNKIIETSEAWSREELDRAAKQLSVDYNGMSLEAIRASLVGLLDEERARYDAIMRRTIELGIGTVDEVLPHDNELFVEGETSLLHKPDFQDADTLRRAFLAFQEKEKLVRILTQCVGEGGLQIVVGSESPFTNDYNLSLVATRYGSDSCPVGMVGIIGPTRMEYPRVAPLVEYLGQAIGRKIEEQEQGR
jgi:heat-inducible transcriptional repressor